jgi:hypothetical protein
MPVQTAPAISQRLDINVVSISGALKLSPMCGLRMHWNSEHPAEHVCCWFFCAGDNAEIGQINKMVSEVRRLQEHTLPAGKVLSHISANSV